MIIAFTAFTITLIILFIWCLHKDEEGWSIILGVSIVCFGIFGWGLFLGTTTEKVEVVESNAKILEILKGKHITVVVSDHGPSDSHIFDGYQSDKIDSTTQFKWTYTVKRNYYNIILNEYEEFGIR
jgi:hypothetical protein